MVCLIGIAANKWNIHYQQWKYFSVQKYALQDIICIYLQNIIFLAQLNPYVTEEVEIILVS